MTDMGNGTGDGSNENNNVGDPNAVHGDYSATTKVYCSILLDGDKEEPGTSIAVTVAAVSITLTGSSITGCPYRMLSAKSVEKKAVVPYPPAE